MSARWYVVQCHPRKERFVRERLEDLGCSVFLPLIKERIPGRRQWRLGPLFPGYLFAGLDEDTWNEILSVNLKGPFFCTRAARDALVASGDGDVVMTSSVASLIRYGRL